MCDCVFVSSIVRWLAAAPGAPGDGLLAQVAEGNVLGPLPEAVTDMLIILRLVIAS